MSDILSILYNKVFYRWNVSYTCKSVYIPVSNN